MDFQCSVALSTKPRWLWKEASTSGQTSISRWLSTVDKDSSGQGLLLGLLVTSHGEFPRVGLSAQTPHHTARNSDQSFEWEPLHLHFILRAAGRQVRPRARDIPELTSSPWLSPSHVNPQKHLSPFQILIPHPEQMQ